jgi:hypothetical protein
MTLGPEFDGLPYCPAWCTEAIEGKSVGPKPTGIELQASGESFLRSQDARKIAAFDKWIDLKDRNYGNVIRLNKGGYASIDHESMLHDMLWTHASMNFGSRCLIDFASDAFKPNQFDAFKQHVALAAEGRAQNGVKKSPAHAEASVAAKLDIKSIIDTFLREDGNPDQSIVAQKASEASALYANIEKYLLSRGVEGWMANQLGVIV